MTDEIGKEFFAQNTIDVARQLLGMKLMFRDCEGMIVETEAYRDDLASHAITKPNKGVMLRETYGHVYIFFIYGMYHCLNFTTEKNGVGAVLIRAAEPIAGISAMQERRKTDKLINLSNGPGKLFTAFGLTPDLHGEEVGKDIRLMRYKNLGDADIAAGPRVGISKAADLPWRFYIKENKFVSRHKQAAGVKKRM